MQYLPVYPPAWSPRMMKMGSSVAMMGVSRPGMMSVMAGFAFSIASIPGRTFPGYHRAAMLAKLSPFPPPLGAEGSARLCLLPMVDLMQPLQSAPPRPDQPKLPKTGPLLGYLALPPHQSWEEEV